MTILKDLLLGILKSVLVAVILTTISMSLIQKKFPPSFDDSRKLIQSLKNVYELTTTIKAPNVETGEIDKSNILIASREKLLNEMKKLEPTTQENPIAEDKQKMPTIPDMNRRDLLTLNTKLDQAEYKIRILELEMKQLKDEYRKLRAPGGTQNTR